MTKKNVYYIIDDDTDDQQFLLEALTENDSESRCFATYDARGAVLRLTNATEPLPSAIFLDLNMPGMSGRQCLSELKKTPSLTHIPVIIYSTTSDEDEIRSVMGLGASYFLIKGNSFGELKDKLAPIILSLCL